MSSPEALHDGDLFAIAWTTVRGVSWIFAYALSFVALTLMIFAAVYFPRNGLKKPGATTAEHFNAVLSISVPVACASWIAHFFVLLISGDRDGVFAKVGVATHVCAVLFGEACFILGCYGIGYMLWSLVKIVGYLRPEETPTAATVEEGKEKA